jgi:release factor glutamine methyltransferase
MSTERWTILKLLSWTEDFFRQKNIESPRLEAQILLGHVLKCDRIHLYTRTDEEPDEASRAAFRELIKKRADGTPVAYLVGYREFYSLKFEVTPDVLIPRPETELLVLKCLDRISKISKPKILDVGTGSGCIAITLAKQNSAVQVQAIDRSDKALAVARNNAQRHEVSDRIQFLAGDLFQPLKKEISFDLIVSNPPYISEAEYSQLDKSVRDFEPREALLAGADGLDIYRRLIPESVLFLKSKGFLAVEIGSTQQENVEQIFRESFTDVTTIRDDAKLPRIVLGKKR